MLREMALLKLFGKKQADEATLDYIEVTEADENARGPLRIQVDSLTEFADTDRVQAKLRAGDIVWVKIKTLKEKDMTELKRAVDRLRKTVAAVEGDIAGVDEDYLVLTPKGVTIHREA